MLDDFLKALAKACQQFFFISTFLVLATSIVFSLAHSSFLCKQELIASPRICFLFFWAVVSSVSSVSFSVFLFFCCAIFLHSHFCFLSLLTISVLVLSLLWFRLLSFSKYVPFSFILSLFLRSLALAHFPFSFFLSFFSGLFFSFFPFFDSICVSYCFSYGGFLMLLLFLLYCILSVFPLPSISIFLFFLVNSLFAFGSRWLSPRLLFFSVFIHCFQPSFVLFFFAILKLFALRLIIYFWCYRSLSLPLYTSFYPFWFF